MRFLVVYGYEPSGHSGAARALEAAAVDAGHECVRVNVSSDFNPLLGPAVAALYAAVIRFLPGLWGRLYDDAATARLISPWRRLYLLIFGAQMGATLRELSPDAVVCTHAPPLGALALEKKSEGFPWPLIAVATDYHLHAYWRPPEGADLLITAEEGIPVHPAFAAPPSRQLARAKIGLPPDAAAVVLSGGSRGLGRLEALAAALLERLPKARVVVLCGTNAALARRLKERARAQTGRLWVLEGAGPEAVAEVFAAADVLIGKGGGMTVAESLAVGLPLVLFGVLPGQERRNADYLLSRGAAVEAGGVAAAVAAAQKLLQPAENARARELARRLGRPDSAARAVAAIARLASS